MKNKIKKLGTIKIQYTIIILITIMIGIIYDLEDFDAFLGISDLILLQPTTLHFEVHYYTVAPTQV